MGRKLELVADFQSCDPKRLSHKHHYTGRRATAHRWTPETDAQGHRRSRHQWRQTQTSPDVGKTIRTSTHCTSTGRHRVCPWTPCSQGQAGWPVSPVFRVPSFPVPKFPVPLQTQRRPLPPSEGIRIPRGLSVGKRSDRPTVGLSASEQAGLRAQEDTWT